MHFPRILLAAAATAMLSLTLASQSNASARDLSDDGEASLRTAMGRVDRDWMQRSYYQCNPRPHSEKAYRRGDGAPSAATTATVVGESGRVVVMATAFGQEPVDDTVSYAVVDGDGEVLYVGELPEPGVDSLRGFEPGEELYIQPRTMGTMAKILTPEQIAACNLTLPEAG